MRSLLLLLSLFFSAQSFAQKAVLLEETPPTSSSSAGSIAPGTHVHQESKRGSYLVESSRLRDVFKGGDYASVEALRADRRVGVGVETFGRLGFVGFDVELNFTPMDAATVGIGGGPGYNSFSLGAKHLFGGERVSPYMGLSFTHWNGNSHNKVDGTTPGYLESKFLDEDERNSGQFAKSFIVPSVGVQFNQLQGRSAGATLFAEVLLLVEASTMDQVPTAAFGAMYFF